jgi:hypothetical protein
MLSKNETYRGVREELYQRKLAKLERIALEPEAIDE